MQYVLASILGIGLIFLIINQAIGGLRYKIRALINLIIGFILVGLFTVSFFYEYENGELWKYYPHYLYIGSSLIYSVSFALHFFNVKGLRPDKKKIILSKSYYQEYLFLLYRYKNDIFLVKEKENYKGFILKLKKTDFHDEIIRSINRKNKLVMEFEDIEKTGTITIIKDKQIYHCYSIDLKNDSEIKGLTRVNGFRLIYQDVDDFNKQIIARLMLRKKFDTKL